MPSVRRAKASGVVEIVFKLYHHIRVERVRARHAAAMKAKEDAVDGTGTTGAVATQHNKENVLNPVMVVRKSGNIRTLQLVGRNGSNASATSLSSDDSDRKMDPGTAGGSARSNSILSEDELTLQTGLLARERLPVRNPADQMPESSRSSPGVDDGNEKESELRGRGSSLRKSFEFLQRAATSLKVPRMVSRMEERRSTVDNSALGRFMSPGGGDDTAAASKSSGRDNTWWLTTSMKALVKSKSTDAERKAEEDEVAHAPHMVKVFSGKMIPAGTGGLSNGSTKGRRGSAKSHNIIGTLSRILNAKCAPANNSICTG